MGEGSGGSPEPWLTCSAAQTLGFVPRVSRKTCIARQHRRQVRALSYYPCSSCINAAGLAIRRKDCRAVQLLDGRDGARSLSFPSAVYRAAR